ncbi:MAG: PRC-barrel domain-containing protein [Alphaproteobacteria bacterium]|nr:PRC-barrel domain-containing protein [Alphaproteobacteria bacterium]
MLLSASAVIGYTIEATDGALGSVDEFLFEDRRWIVRWVVVDTGTWLTGRKVLLPPSQLPRVDEGGRSLRVALTRQQIEDSPGIERDPPVSRQQEEIIYRYYGWEPYWGAGFMATAGVGVPPIQPPLYERELAAEAAHPVGDPHLRGAREVTGYYIHARDGDIGHVADLLIDPDGWDIRYLVVDTRNWWPGKNVIVSPQWAADISWSERTVTLDLTRDQIRSGPEYDPRAPMDRAFEERLHSHYGRRAYWF